MSQSTARKSGKTRKTAATRPKTVNFHGLRLELPKKLPSSLYFDLGELDESGGGPIETKKVLVAIYGEDGFAKIRKKIEEKIAGEDVFDEVLALIHRSIEAAGANLGK